MSQADFTEAFLLYFVLPLWVFVGAADWLCHRASHIETTSGPKESAVHLLLMAEAGAALLLGVFCAIDALVIVLVAVFFVAHEFTSYWNLAYAAPRRRISPIEQHIHDYLAVVPFMALSLVLVLHWQQALAVIGAGPDPARWTLAWKEAPLPVVYVAILLAVLVLFDVLPYFEELWRGLRAQRRKTTA